MMDANMPVSQRSMLYDLGQAWVDAGAAYWEEYQRVCDAGAVVWLEMDNGHFLLFTRSEYKDELMACISSLQQEAAMIHPFEAAEAKELPNGE